MTTEQKAKAYDEAIERANSLLSNNQVGNAWIYKLLPELKESDDEKIRKSIIAIINNYVDNSNTFKPKMIAWLEKQGEQKSWSEEDEEIIHCLEYTVRHFYEDEDTINRCCRWLKSLRPQNRWKPSEEQIEAIANATALNEEQGQALYSLYNELKEIKD